MNGIGDKITATLEINDKQNSQIIEIRDLKSTNSDFFLDKYNRLHKYRRLNDSIMLYYNIYTQDIIIVAVKPGDSLQEAPFSLPASYEITERIVKDGILTPGKGIIEITKQNLKRLVQLSIINEEAARVIYFNKKNVGFFL